MKINIKQLFLFILVSAAYNVSLAPEPGESSQQEEQSEKQQEQQTQEENQQQAQTTQEEQSSLRQQATADRAAQEQAEQSSQQAPVASRTTTPLDRKAKQNIVSTLRDEDTIKTLSPDLLKQYLQEGSLYEFKFVLGGTVPLEAMKSAQIKVINDALSNKWETLQFKNDDDKQSSLDAWIKNMRDAMTITKRDPVGQITITGLRPDAPIDDLMALWSNLLSKVSSISDVESKLITQMLTLVINQTNDPVKLEQIFKPLDPLIVSDVISNKLSSIINALTVTIGAQTYQKPITPAIGDAIKNIISLITSDRITAMLADTTGSGAKTLDQIKNSLQQIGSMPKSQQYGMASYDAVITTTIDAIRTQKYQYIITWLKDLIKSIPTGLKNAYNKFIQAFNSIVGTKQTLSSDDVKKLTDATKFLPTRPRSITIT